MQVDSDERYYKMQINSAKQKIYNLKFNQKCDDNAITERLIYMLPLEFQGLNVYFICLHWSSTDEMAIVYSSFKIIGTKWLLHMPPQSEFQALNG